jgi:hypothetical protein
MDDDFHNSLADWHRAEAAAAQAEHDAGLLQPSVDDMRARTLRAKAVELRRAADELLDVLLRLAGGPPADPPNG